MKVFVTGADGFIGSHLVELLLTKKCYVIALCHYNSHGSIGWLEDIKVKNKANLKIRKSKVLQNIS